MIGFVLAILYLYKINYQIKEEVKVPTIIGKKEEEGIKKLSDLGLNYEVIYQDEEDAENVIVKTNPSCGSIVKKDSLIEVYISRKKEKNKMPSLLKIYYDDAVKKLDELDFALSIKTLEVVDNDLPVGYVKKQSPKENTTLKSGDEIYLYVVIHDNEVKIPSFIGLKKEDLKNYESIYGLIFEIVYEDSSEPEGTVIAQSIAEGEVIIKNTKNIIRITVSKGINNYIPDFVGLDIEDAIHLATIFDVSLEINYVYSNAEKNTVISQKKMEDKVILYVAL